MASLPKSSEVVLELVLDEVLELVLDECHRRSEGGEHIEPLGHSSFHLLTRLKRGKAQNKFLKCWFIEVFGFYRNGSLERI